MQLLRDNLTLWTSDMQAEGILIIYFLKNSCGKLQVNVLVFVAEGDGAGDGEKKEKVEDVENAAAAAAAAPAAAEAAGGEAAAS